MCDDIQLYYIVFLFLNSELSVDGVYILDCRWTFPNCGLDWETDIHCQIQNSTRAECSGEILLCSVLFIVVMLLN